MRLFGGFHVRRKALHTGIVGGRVTRFAQVSTGRVEIFSRERGPSGGVYRTDPAFPGVARNLAGFRLDRASIRHPIRHLDRNRPALGRRRLPRLGNEPPVEQRSLRPL